MLWSGLRFPHRLYHAISEICDLRDRSHFLFPFPPILGYSPLISCLRSLFLEIADISQPPFFHFLKIFLAARPPWCTSREKFQYLRILDPLLLVHHGERAATDLVHFFYPSPTCARGLLFDHSAGQQVLLFLFLSFCSMLAGRADSFLGFCSRRRCEGIRFLSSSTLPFDSPFFGAGSRNSPFCLKGEYLLWPWHRESIL